MQRKQDKTQMPSKDLPVLYSKNVQNEKVHLNPPPDSTDQKIYHIYNHGETMASRNGLRDCDRPIANPSSTDHLHMYRKEINKRLSCRQISMLMDEKISW